jgi:hypothetical protein
VGGLASALVAGGLGPGREAEGPLEPDDNRQRLSRVFERQQRCRQDGPKYEDGSDPFIPSLSGVRPCGFLFRLGFGKPGIHHSANNCLGLQNRLIPGQQCRESRFDVAHDAPVCPPGNRILLARRLGLMARLLNQNLLPTVSPKQCAQRFHFFLMTALFFDTLTRCFPRLSYKPRGLARIADRSGDLEDSFEREFFQRQRGQFPLDRQFCGSAHGSSDLTQRSPIAIDDLSLRRLDYFSRPLLRCLLRMLFRREPVHCLLKLAQRHGEIRRRGWRGGCLRQAP